MTFYFEYFTHKYANTCSLYEEFLANPQIAEKEIEKIEYSLKMVMNTLFFDLKIVCADIIYPCHKNVLSVRSSSLRNLLSSDIKDICCSEFEPDVVLALLRWLYTDKIDFDSEELALGLLKISFKFELSSLFEASERMLAASIHEKSYLRFYGIAKELGANILAQKCEDFAQYCYDLPSELLNDTNKVSSVLSQCTEITSIDRRENVEHTNEERVAYLLKITHGFRKYLLTTDINLNISYSLFPAHRYILGSRWETFFNEISSDPIRENWTEHTPLNCISAILSWIYTGEIVMGNVRFTMQMLTASHRLNLSEFIEVYDAYVVDTVTLSTCAIYLSAANSIGASRVYQHCVHLLSGYWQDAKSNDINELLEMIKNEPLQFIENSIQESESSEPLIMNLNYDCLLELFNYIPLRDLSSIHSTCGKFRNLAGLYFKIYGDKVFSISFSSMFEDLWNFVHFGDEIDFLAIQDDAFGKLSWDHIFAIVAKGCNINLKGLHLRIFSETGVEAYSLALLQGILKNLEILKLIACTNGNIELLLSYCHSLMEVHLYGYNMEISTLWCTNNDKIKRITLQGMKYDNVLETICKTFVHLEYVYFDCSSFDMNTTKINCLAQLDHLKELQICFPCDDVGPILTNLARKDILEDLSLLNFHVSESVAVALGEFTKLKKLTFVFIQNGIQDNVVELLSTKLQKIEKLFFSYCDTLTFTDITKMIEKNLQLKELWISCCERISRFEKSDYQKLKKYQRNLTILVEAHLHKHIIELIKDEMCPSVKVLTLPADWNTWKK